ncbi:hypothetical protein AK830_g3239 [Neonectria ditissima]|uniref:Uncharacterized protein n=1 Tax=Neonectria ditissima TaxID=78410 RepID=A0A0P7BIB2_9HYPO|nr:hypothetical protein AK830_g3239 [Neonectria ditissima]
MASPHRMPDWTRLRDPPKFRDMTTTEHLMQFARWVAGWIVRFVFVTQDLIFAMTDLSRKAAFEVRGLTSLVAIIDEFLERIRSATYIETIHMACILYSFYWTLFQVYCAFSVVCLPALASTLTSLWEKVQPIESIPSRTRNVSFGLVISTLTVGALVIDWVTFILVIFLFSFSGYQLCLALKFFIMPTPPQERNNACYSPPRDQSTPIFRGRKPPGAAYVNVKKKPNSQSPPEKANISKYRSDPDIKRDDEYDIMWGTYETGHHKQVIGRLQENLEIEKSRVQDLEAKVNMLEKQPQRAPELAKPRIDELQRGVEGTKDRNEEEKRLQGSLMVAQKRICDLEKKVSELEDERKTAEGHYPASVGGSSRPADYKYQTALHKLKKEGDERKRLETATLDHLAQIERLYKELNAMKKAKKDKERPYERALYAARQRVIAQDVKMGEFHKLIEETQAKSVDFTKLQELFEETQAKLEWEIRCREEAAEKANESRDEERRAKVLVKRYQESNKGKTSKAGRGM